MFASKDLFLTQPAGATGYQISRSVRTRSSASAYFNRTLSTPTSNTTWTLSCWLKRGALSNGGIFAESTGYAGIYFASDKIRVMDNAGSVALETTAVYRDPSAWAHLVVRSNGTNIKAYWNSVEVGSYTGTITLLNAATSHFIGRYSSNYFDGYLTEINFIDGQALTPSSFGATNTTTGVWGPTAYTGTYGTNGFYLNFSDNSAATAAAIGKDYSGNGNNWTPNNISVTASVTYDSMVDTPTPYGSDSGAGGEVRGNYAVMNPLFPGTSSYLTNGNLNASISAANTNVIGTFQIPSSGKWYWEYQITTIAGGGAPMGGIATTSASSPAVFYRTSGNKLVDGTETAYGATYTTTDTIGVAVNVDGGTITFYKGTASQGNITYAASGFYPAIRSNVSTDVFNINFGQRPFANTAPSGFKALCTQNLSTPTIANGASYMAATTYTGNGGTQTVANSGSFAPDFVWVKNRGTAGTDHGLFDTVRGATKRLASNLTSAETTEVNSLTAFTSTGFTVGTAQDFNQNGVGLVGWQWKAGGSSSSNTSGSITSTVSVNQTAGFSVVTYTGTGANATVGHGLGVAPKMVIAKSRSLAASVWPTYHVGLTSASYSLELQSTAAQTNSYDAWNSTAPSSSVVSIGTPAGINTNGATYVMYCFAPIAGYSAFGSYTGNGSADGTFVYLGFRPRFVLMKSSTLVTNWWIIDTARNTYNVANALLTPSNNYAEDTTYNVMDVTSNGFKIRTTYTGVNSSNDTYIYAAFAENPFKYALAR